jgi:hypothetical protein
LAEVALEIEAELTDVPYRATRDELKAIDEGLRGDAANPKQGTAGFPSSRRQKTASGLPPG